MMPLYNINASGGNYGYLSSYNNLTGSIYSAPRRPFSLTASTNYPGLIFNQQTIEQYYAILDMLSEMYMINIAGLATRFIADAIMESLRKEPSVYIAIPEDQKIMEKASEIVYKWIEKVDINKIIKMTINDIVYYGSYTFSIDEDYNLHNLYDPYSAVSVVGKNMNEIGYLLNSTKGIVFIPREEAHILRLGIPDLMLYSDMFHMNKEDYVKYIEQYQSPRVKHFAKVYDSRNRMYLSDHEKLFIRPYVFIASTPLFYFTRTKLREYVIKDIVLGLTTLRDLLYPIVFMMQYDYPAINYTVQSLADQIEEILNAYADIGGFVGVRADLIRILNMITYSIRVLPDFKGHISNLTPLDTSKLAEKLDKYRGEMRDLLEDISNDIGWPIDAFNSRITYWESMRQSERFNNKIAYIVQGIEKSLSIFLSRMVCKKLKMPINENIVQIQLFDLTISKLMRMSMAQETISSYITGTFDLIDNIISVITDKEGINKEKIADLMRSYLYYIVPNPEEIIDWEGIIKKAEETAEEMAGEEEFDEDFGFGLKGAEAEEAEGETEGLEEIAEEAPKETEEGSETEEGEEE